MFLVTFGSIAKPLYQASDASILMLQPQSTNQMINYNKTAVTMKQTLGEYTSGETYTAAATPARVAVASVYC